MIRNLAEHIQQQQANRLAEFAAPTREQLIIVEESDVAEAAGRIVPGVKDN